jgi:hypothetical protein
MDERGDEIQRKEVYSKVVAMMQKGGSHAPHAKGMTFGVLVVVCMNSGLRSGLVKGAGAEDRRVFNQRKSSFVAISLAACFH